MQSVEPIEYVTSGGAASELYVRRPRKCYVECNVLREESLVYAPNGFNMELSIELGKLVSQAYAQFRAFETEELGIIRKLLADKGNQLYLDTNQGN